MYILKDENSKIVAHAKDYASICNSKIMLNNKNGAVDITDEKIILHNGKFYLESEFQEYKLTEEYKYDEEKLKAKNEIFKLKKELEEEDYKVIKAIEAKLCSEELPYDVEELTRERKIKRNRINELEHQFVF